MRTRLSLFLATLCALLLLVTPQAQPSGMIINAYRHAIPFLPTDIAGCQLWLRADSILASDGDPVTLWEDESGEGYDATVPMGSNAPTLDTSILNGKPVVKFDSASTQTLRTTPGLTADYTLIFVVRMDATAYYNMYMSADSNTASVAYVADNGFYIWGASGFYAYWNDPGWHIFTVKKSAGGTATVYRDLDTPVSGSTDAIFTALNFATNGAGFYSSTSIAEVIAYDSQLSDTDRGKVRSYLASRYGL